MRLRPTLRAHEVPSPGAERAIETDQALREAIGEYVHLDHYAPNWPGVKIK